MPDVAGHSRISFRREDAMGTRNRRLVRDTLSVLALVGLMTSVGGRRAEAAPGICTAAEDVFVTTVDRIFTGGSRWTFSIYRATCEGFRITAANFKPDTGTSRQVLAAGSLAQVHVPYLHGDPIDRFHDLSHSGALGLEASTLSPAECSGQLFSNNTICVHNDDGGYGFKYTRDTNLFRTAQAVTVFMSSQLGEYNYINKWTFRDNGTIDVELGLTGALQILLTDNKFLNYGARLNPQIDAIPSIGIAHQHNAYYRLDFDLDGASNDVVSRKAFVPSTAQIPGVSWNCTTAGQCGTVNITPITVESAQGWSSLSEHSWIIQDKVTMNADGRRIGYELLPHVGGTWDGMVASEPWSTSEVWVTRFNGCERLAFDNHVPHIPPSCSGVTVGDHVQAMVSPPASTDGQDVVVWYANRHLHYPRDEDEVLMPIEWMGFSIKPRGFHAFNPAGQPTSQSLAAAAATGQAPNGFTTSSVPPPIKR
jgi:primary-amine oxidase